MYISNPSQLQNNYKCNKIIANHLIKQGFPLLSRDDSGFYFSKTKELEDYLLKLPFYLKLFL